MPKIGYSANGFGKFCEVYEAVEASFEAADAVGGLVDAVEAARGRINGIRRKHFPALGSSRRRPRLIIGQSSLL